ncbi:hypothetical protein HY346_01555 [Candidatus Microgenomates bacterium]|nr:hypothetical protein [Candidatus Microgenomates bacterium]
MTQIGAITGLGDVAEQQEAAGRQQQVLRSQLSDLQRSIVDGETELGDKLEEGLIAVYGAELASAKFRGRAVAAYRDFNTRLKGQDGQPVLILHRFLSQVPGCIGFGQELKYQTTSEETLGVLGRDSIFFMYEAVQGNLATAYLPTTARIRLRGGATVEGGMVSISEAATSHRGFLCDESRPIDLARETGEMVEDRFMGRRIGRSHPALEILVGNGEISDWINREMFVDKGYLEIVRAAIQMGIEFPVVERFSRTLKEEREKLQEELDAIAAREAKLDEELATQPDRKAEIFAKAAALGIQLTTTET